MVGESGGWSQLKSRLNCFKILGCSTLGCQRGCNAGGQLSNQFTAAIGNMAKMCWLYSFLVTRETALSLLSCILCLVGESGFSCILKYWEMGKVLYLLLFYPFVRKPIIAQFYIGWEGNQEGGHDRRVDWIVSKHWAVLHWDVRGVVMLEGNYRIDSQQQ